MTFQIVEVNNRLEEQIIKTTSRKTERGVLLCMAGEADKRYGKQSWVWRETQEMFPYIESNSGPCLGVQPA